MRVAMMVAVLAAVAFGGNLVLALNGSYLGFLDEQTYIAAALQIAHGQSCSIVTPFSTLCNYEHPPLVKVLEAVSYRAFGWAIPSSAGALLPYQAPLSNWLSTLAEFLSFRFFQMIMGALSPVLIYLIADGISGNKRLALLAAVLLVLDPLYAFFSRTAYLDIPMVFFALCAYAVYFKEYRLGPVNRFWLAGIFLALSTLSKETGVIFAIPLAAYHLIFGNSAMKKKVAELGYVVGAETLVAAVGLQLFDTLGSTPFPTFLNHISYMITFSREIACGSTCYVNFTPGPWYTILTWNYWSVGLSNNQVLLWLILLWVPFGVWALSRSRKAGVSPEDKLFVFALLLFGVSYLANELVYLGGRIIWIWYLLPVIPSLCLGGAYLLTRREIPRWLRVVMVFLIFVGFFFAYLTSPKLLLYD